MSATVITFTAMADFPNRINHFRRKRDLSQQKLADLVGCTKMQISQLERGQTKLTVDWMRLISSALDIAPADLLNDEDVPDRIPDDAREYVERYLAATPDQRRTLNSVAEAVAPYHGPPSVNENDTLRKAV